MQTRVQEKWKGKTVKRPVPPFPVKAALLSDANWDIFVRHVKGETYVSLSDSFGKSSKTIRDICQKISSLLWLRYLDGFSKEPCVPASEICF